MQVTQAAPRRCSPRAPQHSVQHAADAKWFSAIPGESIAVRIRATQTEGRFTVIESIAGTGSAAPLHSHAEVEVFQVIEGTATFRLGERVLDVGPGGSVTVPAGLAHAWINRSPTKLRMLAVFAPAGIEELFERIASVPAERLAELAAGYGTIILGPPMPM